MLRPHTPLFAAATDAPVAPAAAVAPPPDFKDNTVHDTEGFTDVGDVSLSPDTANQPPAAPVAPVAPIDPAQSPQPRNTTEFEPQAPTPLPQSMQPAPTGPAAVTPVAPVNPLVAMNEAMMRAFPDATPAVIAAKVAAALQSEAQTAEPPAPVEDPDQTALTDIETRLEALRTQAKDEGTSDYDADIRQLELQQVGLTARLQTRAEIEETQAAQQFVSEAQTWDARAGQAFPDSDRKGSPLDLAVTARIAAIKAVDPEYFNRTPDAGFGLVAVEAAKLGIAPQPIPQAGSLPTPQQPQPIQAPVAQPGFVQASHRPGEQQPMDAGQQFLRNLQAAEQAGFGAELMLAKQAVGQAFNGVQFVS